jgi:gamma-glutamylcyclotransferase
MLYFAYGSNLDWAQMRQRCPSARFVCVAKLPGHRLAFTRKSKGRGCGVADVVPEANADVWGAVFEIDDRDIGSLDATEGFSPGRTQNSYTREERHVFNEGNAEKPLTVSVYIALKQSHPPLPNAAYKGLIVEGAKFWHLPAHYVAELEKIEIEGPVRGGSSG